MSKRAVPEISHLTQQSLLLHSPWSDKYETAEYNRYSEPVRQFVASRMVQLKSEAVVYSLEEFLTRETRGAHPQVHAHLSSVYME